MTMKRLIALISALALLAFAPAQASEQPFPRLGMWWLDAYDEPAASIARYGLLLNEFEWLPEKLAEVRALNPSIQVYRPLSPSERELFIERDGEEIANPEIASLPSGFFLLEVGSTLSRPLDEDDTRVYLERVEYADGTPMFHAGGEVAIGDGESAHVVAVDEAKKMLTVQRGYVRAAAAHEAGEHVASHVRFWPGSWVMNVTAACPKAKVAGLKEPVNWIEYLFQLTQKLDWPIYRDEWENSNYIDQADLHYDGIVIDRFEDVESWLSWVDGDAKIGLDLNQDNTIVTDEAFDASWRAGTDELYTLLQKAYPGLPIIRNNPLTRRLDRYNGQVYETGGWSKPSLSWWNALFIKTDSDYYADSCYMDWFRNGKLKPTVVMVETYEDESSPDADGDGGYVNPFDQPGFTPNYRRMRFSLASTLMGDGWYSYEINTDGHGSLGLMWFDEYDNAGKGRGYLGMPLGACARVKGGAWVRKFQRGLALVNPTGKAVTVKLPKGKWRRIKGRQCPKVNSGKRVSSVKLPAHDGLILVRGCPPLPCRAGPILDKSKMRPGCRAFEYGNRGAVHQSAWVSSSCRSSRCPPRSTSGRSGIRSRRAEPTGMWRPSPASSRCRRSRRTFSAPTRW
jgi:hypothetical protein